GGLLFFLHLLGVLSDAETWVMRKLSSQEARLSETAGSLRQTAGAPFHVGEIIKENERLRADNAALDVEIARLTSIRDENDELRALLGFVEKQKTAPVVARVLARTPEAGTHTILIDRGSDDGIAVEMPVIAAGGVLIGKIFKVDRASSVALLLTDTRSRVGASVQNAARTQGEVQGERGLSLEMRLIPQNEEIKVGDLIVTSGIEPLTPRGLVLGRVDEVLTQEKNPFKKALISSPVAFDRVSVVVIPFP
ncbi:MAG TPA: rod shape-determining protein MreC, partial [Candidatus Baltobacteraceae bacterium]|nr:rod shape-determining protein MreC [Candidatus Baltobacteraceae bacterium]